MSRLCLEVSGSGPFSDAYDALLAYDRATAALRWKMLEGATVEDIQLAQTQVEATWARYRKASDALLALAVDAPAVEDPRSGAV